MPYGTCNILNEKNSENGILIETLEEDSNVKIYQSCVDCGQVFMRSFKQRHNLHLCKPFFDGTKRCCICHNKKEPEWFPRNRSSFDGYGKICKDCFADMPSVKIGYKKKNEEIKNDLLAYFKHKASSVRSAIRMKKRQLESDITGEFLLELYEKQNGLCFYSGIKISHNRECSFDSISIDRLDPNLGYLKSNVVICANGINSMKGNLSETDFKQVLTAVIPHLTIYSETK